MVVVSDSSTLIILSDLNRLDYLQNIFNTIYIPPKVYEEISFKREFTLPDFIKIESIKDNQYIDYLNMILDAGESQAIALAIEKNLPLIIDEKKGRRVAKNLSVDIIGLLGVIYLNIRGNFITIKEAKEFLDRAKDNNYRISSKLIDDMFNRLEDEEL